jgi:hypothetical protein
VVAGPQPQDHQQKLRDRAHGGGGVRQTGGEGGAELASAI